MEIHQLLTPYNYSDGSLDRIRYIVIHYVGAIGGAQANCEYFASKYIGASAHYFVGFDGEIWQSVEDKNIAWHCGANAYNHPECRNSNSIGIELCVRNSGSQAATSRDWYFEDATVYSAAALTRHLMAQYSIPSDHVVRHYDVTGKICPNPYVYNHTSHTWTEFLALLEDADFTESRWEKDDQGRYRYLQSDGTYASNQWLLINHHWYLFGQDAYMRTGWQRLNGTSVVEADDPGDWYFLDNTPDGPLEGACWHSRANGAQEIWYVEEP
jgi:hypothetical protein